MLGAFSAIFVRDARLALLYPLQLVTPWGKIVVAVAGFWYLARLVPSTADQSFVTTPGGYFAYVTVNVAFFSVIMSTLYAFSSGLQRDQSASIIEPSLTTGTTLWRLVAGSALWPVTIGCAEAVWYLVVAVVLFGLRFHVSVISVLLVMIVCIVTVIPFGVLSAAFALRFRQQSPLNVLFGGAAAMLSGLMFPISLLPSVVRTFAWFLPLTHLLSMCRAVLTPGSGNIVLNEASWLTLCTIVALPIAATYFVFVERTIRRHGSLGFQ